MCRDSLIASERDIPSLLQGRYGLERAWEQYLRGKKGLERFVVNAKGLIHSNQAEQIYAKLQKLGVGPYMIEAEGRELGTGLSLRGTLEVALY